MQNKKTEQNVESTIPNEKNQHLMQTKRTLSNNGVKLPVNSTKCKRNGESEEVVKQTEKKQWRESKRETKNRNMIKNEEVNNQISVKVKKGVKSFKCNFCLRIFNNKLDVESHILNVHTTEKRFGVKGINEESANKERFTKRRIIRDNSKVENKLTFVKKNGIEKFQCNICKKLFKTKRHARSHIITVHNKEERYECNICHAKFIYYYALMTHIQTIHEAYGKYKCDDCEKIFRTQQYLKQHLKRNRPLNQSAMKMKKD
ncbi:zinc finger protein 1-like protein [Leptotrombidium deliense]|uniref:Zinc finger protein 1-like protein n=1 Tax=Leptotrombidium deliense TaxID=299467 RepID=A0A443RWP2_9ACAR|nr:zinc finger protein 1-like protein [Leptotrombidium deliense]